LKEEAYDLEYMAKNDGLRWRHFFGQDGPRPRPTLNMWPAPAIGAIHEVNSSNGHWQCDGLRMDCQDTAPITSKIEVVSTRPKVFIIEDFLSDHEVAHIKALAMPKVKESTVGNNDGGGILTSSTRTSRNTWIPRSTSEVTDTISRRVADVLGLDEAVLWTSQNSEDMQVVHYKDNQRYDPHTDWGVQGHPESRFITLLMYLNDPADEGAGGETSFPKGGCDDFRLEEGCGFKVTPKKGMAAFFYNLLEDGNGDDLSLHAALPVTRGEKWLANFWIWDPKRKN
jgi:prolyl 4-hydroxylase